MRRDHTVYALAERDESEEFVPGPLDQTSEADDAEEEDEDFEDDEEEEENDEDEVEGGA